MKLSQFAPRTTHKSIVLQPETRVRFPSVLCDGGGHVVSWYKR
jgi:hypothetical protein